MTRDYLYRRDRPRLIPLACHECGEVCTERGMVYERRAGWITVGSECAVTVRFPDGTRRKQRIGACPEHRDPAPPQRAGDERSK